MRPDQLVFFIPVVLMGILSLVFQVVVIAAGVVVAWRWLHRPGGWASMPRPREKSAVEILEERYARGEIDATEFEERRQRLRGQRA